jgi:hypothetical protein
MDYKKEIYSNYKEEKHWSDHIKIPFIILKSSYLYHNIPLFWIKQSLANAIVN